MRARASTGAEYHGGGDPGLDRLRTVLGGWRDSLLDMGGRNRLLNFRHTKTSTLEFNSPDATAILAGLGRARDRTDSANRY